MTRRIVLIAAALLASSAALAQNLTLGTKLELNTLDPHFFAAFPTNSSMQYFFDKLVEYGDKLEIRPALATSWKLVDDTTWEFKLRDGVKFHDGTPFTADDVIFTIDRVPSVPNSPNSFAQFTRGIESVKKVDDHTIVVKTKAPNPQLLSDFANIFIVSARAAKGATTADFNSGKAVVGTGPYKLVKFTSGELLEVERNDAYWGGKPQWAHVTERIIAKDPTRLASLLAGQAGGLRAGPN